MRSTGGKAKVLGSLICTGGVLVLILYRGIPLTKSTYSEKFSRDVSNNLSLVATSGDKQKWIVGSVFLVLSIMCWSCWFLIQSRIGKIYPCKYSSTALMCAIGAVQSAILCFLTNRNYSIWIFRGTLPIFTVLFAVSMPVRFSFVQFSSSRNMMNLYCSKYRGYLDRDYAMLGCHGVSNRRARFSHLHLALPYRFLLQLWM